MGTQNKDILWKSHSRLLQGYPVKSECSASVARRYREGGRRLATRFQDGGYLSSARGDDYMSHLLRLGHGSCGIHTASGFESLEFRPVVVTSHRSVCCSMVCGEESIGFSVWYPRRVWLAYRADGREGVLSPGLSAVTTENLCWTLFWHRLMAMYSQTRSPSPERRSETFSVAFASLPSYDGCVSAVAAQISEV